MRTNLTNIEKQKILKHIEFWNSAKEAAKVVFGVLLIIAMIGLFYTANLNYFNTNPTDLITTFFFEFGLTVIADGIACISFYVITKDKDATTAAYAAFAVATVATAVVTATPATVATVVTAVTAVVLIAVLMSEE